MNWASEWERAKQVEKAKAERKPDDERERADRYARVLNEAGYDGARDWRVVVDAGGTAVILSDANRVGLAMEWAEEAVRAIAEPCVPSTAPAVQWVVTGSPSGFAGRWNFDAEADARDKHRQCIERGDATAVLYRLDPTLVATTETEGTR